MKFLIIRRDNIGDLVCTTPLIHALRVKLPDASIFTLVNSYNQAVLTNNPEVDQVHAYTKIKHRNRSQLVYSVFLDRLKMLWKLRKEHIDYVILAGAYFQPRSLKLARLINPRHIIGFTEENNAKSKLIDMGLSYVPANNLHEVERVFQLLSTLNINAAPGPMHIYPDSQKVQAQRKKLNPELPVIGLHISARKPSNRWPAERFAELILGIHEAHDVQFCLYWSPGDNDNPHHPGDDHKAEQILTMVNNRAQITPVPTDQLEELTTGLAVSDLVICSDGGAMHIAAALNKPIVCFFGKSDAARWYPWGVEHRLIQPATMNVSDISVDEALRQFEDLYTSF